MVPRVDKETPVFWTVIPVRGAVVHTRFPPSDFNHLLASCEFGVSPRSVKLLAPPPVLVVLPDSNNLNQNWVLSIAFQ